MKRYRLFYRGQEIDIVDAENKQQALDEARDKSNFKVILIEEIRQPSLTKLMEKLPDRAEPDEDCPIS
jgi:hypothetical protein